MLHIILVTIQQGLEAGMAANWRVPGVDDNGRKGSKNLRCVTDAPVSFLPWLYLTLTPATDPSPPIPSVYP